MASATVQIFDGEAGALRPGRLLLPDTLGPGEVLVSIETATICQSDVHTFLGRRTEPVPAVLGHEGAGRIISLNSQSVSEPRAHLREGMRVTWSIADSCGACPPCADHGRPQKCRQLFKYGHASIHDGTGLNGCYATHIVLRSGTRIVPMPDTIPGPLAATANCALATMVNVVSNVPEDARKVVIQGAGALGLFGIALLKERGLAQVLCTDIAPARLALAGAFGAQPVDARNGAMAALRHALPEGADAVIEVAGVAQVVAEGVEILREGGYYGFAGMVHPRTVFEIKGETIVRKCLTIHGEHNYAPEHLEQAVTFLQETAGKYPYDRLFGARYPLSRLEEALHAAANAGEPRLSVAPAEV